MASGCYEDPQSLLSVDSILLCQKVNDMLIALAYFSIPVELLYFVTCSSMFPFRWILLQFGAFIVLCGLTHLLTFFTFSPHSFLLMLSLTVAKFLTALVSVATALTLLTLFPQLLRAFVREGLLRRKAIDLDRQLEAARRQEEAGWHVRMLTAQIRRSLDRHTILHTTLVHLSSLLLLHHCSIWMPSPPNHLALTHEVPRRTLRPPSLPLKDPDVAEIIVVPGALVLRRTSALASAAPAEVAAIRLPLLKEASFKGGDPPTPPPGGDSDAYAVLVLALEAHDGEETREWTPQELEIVEAVADQVVVALSHAAVLEESMAVRKELMDRNSMLMKARQEADMANVARSRFERVMGREMAGPARSIKAMLSVLQLGGLREGQQAMAKGGLVMLSLVEDAAVLSRSGDRELELKPRPFSLVSLVKEIVVLGKLLCSVNGVGFEYYVPDGISRRLIGDERRILEVLAYVVEILSESRERGMVVLHLNLEGSSQGLWRQNKAGDFINLTFKVGRSDCASAGRSKQLLPIDEDGDQWRRLGICTKLAQLMHGELMVNFAQQMEVHLQIRLQLERPLDEGAFRPRHLDREAALGLLKGTRILLGSGNGLNRSITMKVLEKAGCDLAVVSSWQDCLEALFLKGNQLDMLLIDVGILDESNDINGRVRKLRSQGWLLVVALLPIYDGDNEVKCLQCGVHGVVYTPVILDELLEELQRVTHLLNATPALSDNRHEL